MVRVCSRNLPLPHPSPTPPSCPDLYEEAEHVNDERQQRRRDVARAVGVDGLVQHDHLQQLVDIPVDRTGETACSNVAHPCHGQQTTVHAGCLMAFSSMILCGGLLTHDSLWTGQVQHKGRERIG